MQRRRFTEEFKHEAVKLARQPGASVAGLMHEAGLKARHKRRRLPGQLLSAVHSIAPNLLDRQFEATGPNQKWAADFTYVWNAEGWLFVAVVLDLY